MNLKSSILQAQTRKIIRILNFSHKYQVPLQPTTSLKSIALQIYIENLFQNVNDCMHFQ